MDQKIGEGLRHQWELNSCGSLRSAGARLGNCAEISRCNPLAGLGRDDMDGPQGSPDCAGTTLGLYAGTALRSLKENCPKPRLGRHVSQNKAPSSRLTYRK